MFRQAVIVAFIVGSILNAWFLIGAMGGYQYSVNVYPLDEAGAERFALWIEFALIVLGAFAWWISRPKSREP